MWESRLLRQRRKCLFSRERFIQDVSRWCFKRINLSRTRSIDTPKSRDELRVEEFSRKGRVIVFVIKGRGKARNKKKYCK